MGKALPSKLSEPAEVDAILKNRTFFEGLIQRSPGWAHSFERS